MPQSRLTINCLPQYTADIGKLLRFLRSLDPVTVVCGIDSMNAADRIYEIQAALPNTKVIGRFIFNGDGGMHLKPQAVGDNRKYIVSPLDALDEVKGWGKLGKDGRMLYLLNEPMLNGASDADVARLSTWMIEAMSLATQRGISLCIGNFGVGHPALNANGEYDPRLDDVLIALSAAREQHTLGIHVYQPADVTTRLEGMVKRCKTLGIPYCRVHITEAGFDVSAGSGALNGYRSRGYSGSQFAAFQIDKMENAYGSYIEGDVLQSVATFVWGGEASWHNFNVEPDTDWQAAILDAESKGLLSVTTSTTPAYKPSLFTAGSKYTLQSKGGERTNVHSSPVVAVDNNLKLIEDKTVVTAIEVRQVAYDFWYRFSSETPPITDGWVSGRGGDLSWTPYLEQPAPPPVVVPPVIPAPFLEVSSERALQMASAYRTLSASYLQDSEASKRAAEASLLLSQDMLTLAQTWDDIAQQTKVNIAA